ncbi:MAG: DUF1573 domain-containing protein [Bacteroidales bacterium]|jgi:hypothetical protein|nr:DUF1573 domain-containing protein [Bacteroidales bacterium]
MKEFLYTFFCAAVLLLSCTGGPKGGNNAGSNSTADTGNAVITFSEYEHHFGQVKAGKTVRHTFTFENTGSGNLVIQSAMTTCGCTVPRYNKRPVAPGKGGTLDVEFDTSGRNGMQAKTITVKSNASVPAVILKITADVI